MTLSSGDLQIICYLMLIYVSNHYVCKNNNSIHTTDTLRNVT